MKLLIADKTFVYELNAKGENRLYFKIYPGCDNDNNRTSEEELAKAANLFAAAPELLEALEYFLTVETLLSHGDDRVTKAKEAIAKAKGE